jgi:hypothetical protein
MSNANVKRKFQSESIDHLVNDVIAEVDYAVNTVFPNSLKCLGAKFTGS